MNRSTALSELHLRVPAKINLFLHVTGRRPDGYHLLESIFCPVNLFDDLSIRLTQVPGIRLTGGLPGVATQDDLIVRAANGFLAAAQARSATFPAFGYLDCGIELSITKRIPAGAGLGGGSADAAFTLMGLNHLAAEPLTPDELAAVAVKLGADVPFFLLGQPAFVSGIGEILEPVNLPPIPLLILKPAAHLPTARIFSDPDLTRNAASVRMSVFGFSDALHTLAFVSEHTVNNLQPVAQRHCPEITDAVQLLKSLPKRLSAKWVRMTGSGSAIFGVFENESTAKAAAEMLVEQLADEWFVWHGHTLSSARLKDQMVQHL